MKKRLTALVFLLALLFFNIQGVEAQTYRFRLDRSEVNIFINEDGTASIEYWLEFYNDPSADPIDFVDIGMPNEDFNLASVRAEIDGKPVDKVGYSAYVKPGFEIALGGNAIPPGQTGKVYVWIGEVRNMLHPGTEKEAEDYASFQFAPTYFGKEYVSGSTAMSVTLYLPPGLATDEPRYFPPKHFPGSETPESGYDEQGRVYYRWQSDQANGHTEYIFGAAFPARMVPESAIVQPPPFSLGIDMEDIFCVGFFLIAFGFFGLIAYAGFQGERKRRLQYLPPKVTIEGHGIKRGLTSVEAAVLLQQPLDKVVTMILFSTIKKGAATVASRDPLKIEATDPAPENLLPYEVEFLNAFKSGTAASRRKELQDLIIKLVNSVSTKMKGFSHKETVKYYEDIIERAWQQVESAETPEVKMEKYDEYAGWTMLDRKHEDRTRDVFGSGPVFVPVWWGRFDPGFGRSSSVGGKGLASPIPSGSGHTISMPTLPGSDFAASMVRGVQSFSAGAIGNLTSFTSGITQKTNPPPPPSRSGSIGGGGGGCACACACAGCACACAGGGR